MSAYTRVSFRWGSTAVAAQNHEKNYIRKLLPPLGGIPWPRGIGGGIGGGIPPPSCMLLGGGGGGAFSCKRIENISVYNTIEPSFIWHLILSMVWCYLGLFCISWSMVDQPLLNHIPNSHLPWQIAQVKYQHSIQLGFKSLVNISKSLSGNKLHLLASSIGQDTRIRFSHVVWLSLFK